MKFIIVIIAIILLQVIVPFHGNSQNTFQKILGKADYNNQDIFLLSDGSYLIVSGDYYNVHILKTDSNGDTLWVKSYDLGVSETSVQLEISSRTK